jgi:hypothetical protein
VLEKKRVRWSWRRDVTIIRRVEKRVKVAARATAGRNVDHRAHQKPHHMMKEAVRFDLEQQTARSIAPPGCSYRASMVILRGRGSKHRERAKAVFAFDHCCCLIE